MVTQQLLCLAIMPHGLPLGPLSERDPREGVSRDQPLSFECARRLLLFDGSLK